MSKHEEDFKPNSLHATLARIIAGQEEANRKADLVLIQVTKTNGRVTALETWRDVVTAKICVLSLAASGLVTFIAWLVERFQK